MPNRLVERIRSFMPGNGKKKARQYQRQEIPRDQHNVSRSMISEPAKKVLHRLNKAGYEAYLVGGGVRDILLGGKPKDFDIATNATPEEVHDLFRNSRLIGRRFRIVHVIFGREVIEVTTFRGNAKDVEDEVGDHEHKTSEHGQLLRDNVYGSQEEDALRRDFTINALYYCIRDFTVIDYANGVQDLKNGLIRLIGDPETRYREDPVRMLRAIRFAGKLGFEIEPETRAPIREMAPLLTNIPPARLFDEVLKLLSAGHGEVTYDLLREYNLLAPLFPETAAAIDAGESDELIRQALRNTDARIARGKSVTPYFMFAAMLWPALQAEWRRRQDHGDPVQPALHGAIARVIGEQVHSTAIPKRFSGPMKEIWELQMRLPRRQGKRAFGTLTHPRFRAAYDFLLVRESAGEIEPGLGQWWTDFQNADESGQSKMIAQLGTSAPRKKRKKRKPSHKRPQQ
ncbi:polynucleotide adenylyltransferase PcnB [Marinobacter persicus]|uniref:Poly(A) polymerase I n=1 Tax=Marinobacter persicus TaxID=930118 RepID=A0A2S6G607_9GAMM|nr:polynucleotide adenylyltransferase PcnB [Marinobacter persicus]PPK51260.1 poly(A) polymerase [Marinobacter persicus]PPK54529.1 poly(A) polymerase [Marinobacter persicus]PPK57855.1 poly(A) polymerase [Marinobacter persicus]